MPTPKPCDERPSGQERAAWVTWYTSRGWREQDLTQAIAPDRTRREMTADLIALQRLAPKAQPGGT